ncbi:hypothetical protein OKW23_001266 [Bacilli bacterium PM5-9]|nr:hypothetical protein [Bacilli bacterium PM5-9]
MLYSLNCIGSKQWTYDIIIDIVLNILKDRLFNENKLKEIMKIVN